MADGEEQAGGPVSGHANEAPIATTNGAPEPEPGSEPGPEPELGPEERCGTSDLRVRLISATVMLAIVIAAMVAGGSAVTGLIAVVAIACLVEFVLLVVKATDNIPFRLAGILAGVVYIGVAAATLAGLDLAYTGAVIALVACADSFAYFVGRTVGGPKLAVRISPSKTWSGLFGAALGGALCLAAIAGVGGLFAQTAGVIGVAAIVGAGLGLLAQAGDLFESWLKRRAGVKDSSRLIPGHGGVFDRVDGLLPVALAVGLLARYF